MLFVVFSVFGLACALRRLGRQRESWGEGGEEMHAKTSELSLSLSLYIYIYLEWDINVTEWSQIWRPWRPWVTLVSVPLRGLSCLRITKKPRRGIETDVTETDMAAIFGFTFCPVGDRKIWLHIYIYIYMELTGQNWTMQVVRIFICACQNIILTGILTWIVIQIPTWLYL